MGKSFLPVLYILAVYLVIGTLYAVYTPLWQAPDEPAHYNYIRSLAEQGRFPIMAQGDYDQLYLSQLTAEGFPPELSVSSLEYEDHQPPLYYLLAVPVYAVSGGSVVALRLYSLVLGGVAIIMAMLMLSEVYPEQPGIVILACGLVAFTPQFVAMMASVNNDALILALLWLWLWLALRFLRKETSSWVLGLVLGFILLTKSTGYGAFPLALLVVFLKHRQAGKPLQQGLRDLVPIFLPAVLLGGVWWLRNILVYGWPDFLGLIRHSKVVVGQPRTVDALAEMGMLPFLTSAVRTTFQSFWGQFGWMGVVLDNRIYRGLLIFTLLAIAGAVWHAVREVNSKRTAYQRNACIVLCTSAVITAALFLGYNISFIQHQGRYLFPALPILAVVMSVGLQQLLDRKVALRLSIVLILLIAISVIGGLIVRDIHLWWVFLLGLALVGLVSILIIPQSWHALYTGGVILGMACLDIVCLFGFIVPILTRN
jgi:hypothetical protein